MPEPRPAAKAKGLGGLNLPGANGQKPGAENLRDEGRVGHDQGKDSPPQKREVPGPQGGEPKRLKKPVQGGDDSRGEDKGDVKQQNQNRNPPDNLDVKAGGLAKDKGPGQQADSEAKPKKGGEGERDQGYENGDAGALEKRVENLGVEVVNGDAVKQIRPGQADSREPVGEIRILVAIGAVHLPL